MRSTKDELDTYGMPPRCQPGLVESIPSGHGAITVVASSPGHALCQILHCLAATEEDVVVVPAARGRLGRR
jgi:hypothetical protein